jgi:hypothetical protein
MVFFDPTNVQRKAVSLVVPNGQYVVKVDKATVKDSDDKTGLNIFFAVAKPEAHYGASFMDNFNLRHPNAQTQEIGQRRFAVLLDLIGLGSAPLASETLIEGKYVKVIVGQKPHWKNVGETQNEVLKYLPLDDSDWEGISLPSDLTDDIPFESPF